MSRDSSLSCGSCHQQKLAFTDGLKTSKGFKGQFVKRNAPTLTNVKNQKSFLRDGVNPSLESQVLVPIQEHDEFDFHILLIAERLKMDSAYVRLSKMAYSRDPDPYVITHSISAFERTLVSNNSPFDRYRKGDSLALSEPQLRGMDLFFNQLYCGDCHNGPDLTNHEFSNNGLYFVYKDTGRMRLTRRESDRAVFKVPTLRNIGVTAPYMHDGNLSSLGEVIEHYKSGGNAHPNQSAIIQAFEITDLEKRDLVHFLQSLTDLDFVNNSAYSP
jgi:cytochrome c peroxidase